MLLIVDGYNLAKSGAVPLSRDAATEEGREELCALLSGYARAKRFRLTVVFDGRGSGSAGRNRAAFKGGTALFSSRAETADDVIRDLARDAPSGTVVVTSDRGLARTLPARNVTVVTCGELADRLFSLQLEEIKGTADEEPARRPDKRGEGHKAKKRDRGRGQILKKL